MSTYEAWKREVLDFVNNHYYVNPKMGVTSFDLFVFFNGNGGDVSKSSIEHVFKRPSSRRNPTNEMIIAFRDLKEKPEALLHLPDLHLRNYRSPTYPEAYLTAFYFWMRREHPTTEINEKFDLLVLGGLAHACLEYCNGTGRYNVTDTECFERRYMWIFRESYCKFVKDVDPQAPQESSASDSD